MFAYFHFCYDNNNNYSSGEETEINKIQSKITNLIVILFVIVCLTVSGFPASVKAATNQNPSKEEIAGIFEQVAQEKQIPAVILKTIAYVESEWRQWDSKGNVVAGYWGGKPNLGIMQVGSYSLGDTATIDRLKNDIEFNIRYGADILNSKWEATPRIGNGERNILENWYFAIWAYYSWTSYNNPNTAKNAGREAYQDKILRLAGTDFYPELIHPVKITPIPASLIPAGTLPSKSVSWQTPQPSHTVEFSPLHTDGDIELIQSVNRISGKDRIETAINIAKQGWPNSFETVIISRSEDFPDALAGAALAKKYNAPILLTPKDSLDSRIEEFIKERRPTKVIILGGNGAVSAQTEDKLHAATNWTTDIRRIAGKDRFETAALIASEFPTDSAIAVAAGYNFPDALSLASSAAGKGIPLLLVTKDSLPQVTRDFLSARNPERIYIAGGDGVISPSVVNQIRTAADMRGINSDNIKQFKGQDRYDTSTQVISEFYPDALKLYLATGENFPDALAGTSLAANTNSPLLLMPPQGPQAGSFVEKYLTALSLKTDVQFEVIGGISAMTDKCIVLVKTILNRV